MSFLKRAIQRGVSNAVGNAIGNAVRQAVEPHATQLANQAAQQLNRQAEQTYTPSANMQGAFSGLEQAANNYATAAAKNVKVCPNCDTTTSADRKFCPECGCALPEQSLAQAAVCTACGVQNNINTKFCAACGAKLPIAIAEEQRQQRKMEAAMAQWDQLLPQYPKWCCGGTELSIDQYEPGNVVVNVTFRNNPYAAQQAVEQYRQVLLQNGFRMAGQYPSMQQLFARIGGTVYNVDTEHCFEGDPDTASIGFCIREPYGGFDYVKPEPRKKTSFMDLFK